MVTTDPIAVTTTWRPGGAFGAPVPADGYYVVVWSFKVISVRPECVTIQNGDFDLQQRVWGSKWSNVAWYTDAKAMVEALPKPEDQNHVRSALPVDWP